MTETPPVSTTNRGRAPAPAVALSFHHVGVAVGSITQALRLYVDVLGFRQVTEPVHVPTERVRVCFVEADPGVLIELIEGVDDDSPVAALVERSGGGPYHICYQVDDLDVAIASLRKRHCRPFRRFELEAHGMRRFAFLYAPGNQLIELCEPSHETEPTGSGVHA